jgi:hypothetical protein
MVCGKTRHGQSQGSSFEKAQRRRSLSRALIVVLGLPSRLLQAALVPTAGAVCLPP